MTRIEKGGLIAASVELLPAAFLNFAVAYAVANVLRLSGMAAQAAFASALAGVAAFLCAWFLLRRAGGEAEGRFRLPHFEPAALEQDDRSRAEAADQELLLTAELTVQPAGDERQPEGSMDAAEPNSAAGPAEELLLDDVLARIESGSRVVQLFDPQRMPTAGELRERIDRHLESGAADAQPADASYDLHQAIEALRSSLR